MKKSTDVAYDVMQIEEMLLPHHLKSLQEKSGIVTVQTSKKGLSRMVDRGYRLPS